MIKLKYPILILLFFLQAGFLIAQPSNWQNLDLQKDSVFGMSTEKAYKELLFNKKGIPVIVAVVDGGVDINHEDLRSVIWSNPKEKAGNGIDDDANGYVDDMHGWSFIGSAKGNEHYDNNELTRLIREQSPRFKGIDAQNVPESLKAGYSEYARMVHEHDSLMTVAKQSYRVAQQFKIILDAVLAKIGKGLQVTAADLQHYTSADNRESFVLKAISDALTPRTEFRDFYNEQVDGALKHFSDEIEYHLNLDFDPRVIVGDDYNNDRQKDYGCPDVTGPDADHGTHVSGIIAAVRNNGIGVNGVADHAIILPVRIVPDGDERDKDVANGIRYAVDNGARVINMSFGKGYVKDRQVVAEAVQYALSKDVVLVHASGNDGVDLDAMPGYNYPNPGYVVPGSGTGAWIEVGASGFKNDETLAASFSNYGKHTVDVYAPGISIYSTEPGSKYGDHDGTSMAAPMVSGLAALIRSYYPSLKGFQVKQIILASVKKPGHLVTIKKDGGDDVNVRFSDLCISGGIVNAYDALKLAGEFK